MKKEAWVPIEGIGMQKPQKQGKEKTISDLKFEKETLSRGTEPVTYGN